MEERFGIRLKVLGKTRSGKSTALYRLVSHLVPLEWSQIIVFDGKRDSLRFSKADPRVEYYHVPTITEFAVALDIMATQMQERYAAMEAGRPTLPTLIIADEIQAATRDRHHKKIIKESLIILAEQSAALGDVMILGTQRQQNSIPPGVTANCNASLTMLGLGYFHYKADGARAAVGRATFIEPDEAEQLLRSPAPHLPNSATLAPTDVLNMLDMIQPVPTNGRLTLYVGESGAGLTHALEQHPNSQARHVYVNLAEHSHKTALEAVLTQCNAVVPQQVKTGDLAAMAALSIAAEPTLLKLDNVQNAPLKMHQSINHIFAYAAESAFAFAASDEADVVQLYAARGQRHKIAPLDRRTAQQLAQLHLDKAIDGRERQQAAAHVVRMGRGHPATIVRLAHNIERGELAELRRLEGRKPAGIPLGWLILVGVVVLLMAGRMQSNSYAATLALMAGYLILRPFVSRAVRGMFEDN